MAGGPCACWWAAAPAPRTNHVPPLPPATPYYIIQVEKIGQFTGRVVGELRSRLAGLRPKADSATAEAAAAAAAAATPSSTSAAGAPPPPAAAAAGSQERAALMEEAKRIGEDYLALEKFVNLNYMGVHKILKKHDKMLPHSPCRQFYIAHLHQQPWVQGNYSDVLVNLSNVYSQLRGDASGKKNDDAAQGFVRSTTKYWVRAEDVSNVKYHVLQHLPVFQHDKDKFGGGFISHDMCVCGGGGGGDEGRVVVKGGFKGRGRIGGGWRGEGSRGELRLAQHRHPNTTQPPSSTTTNTTPGSDAQLINSVYFDNESLELYHGRLDKKPGAIAVRIRWYGAGEPRKVFVERKTHRESWKGEESVKERFTLDSSQVVPFLEMEYDWPKAEADLRAAGKSDDEVEKFAALFNEVRNQVDSKQLRPFIRTQYMRTAFQIPFDSTVRVSMDTNLCMIKENPEDGPSCT